MTCFHGIYPWAIFNSTWSTAMNICIKIVYYYADHHTKYTALWTLFPSMHISKTKNREVTYSGVNKKTKGLLLMISVCITDSHTVSQSWALLGNPITWATEQINPLTEELDIINLWQTVTSQSCLPQEHTRVQSYSRISYQELKEKKIIVKWTVKFKVHYNYS